MRIAVHAVLVATSLGTSACLMSHDYKCSGGGERDERGLCMCPDGTMQSEARCIDVHDADIDDVDACEGCESIDAAMPLDAEPDTGLDRKMDAEVDAKLDAAPDAALDAAPEPNGTTERDAGTACAFDCKLGRGRRITAGWRDTCVINNAGSVYCWGNNDEGEVGDGTQVRAPSPVRVVLPKRAVEVSLKGHFACAVLEDGALYCWGQNTEGQLGTGAVTDRELAPRKTTLANVVEVQAGGNFTCARQDGATTLRCWGHGRNLGLGEPQPGSPVPLTPDIGGVAGFNAFGASGQNVCALHGDGTISGRVSCWGWNQFGQAGADPMTAMWVYDPTVVSGISGARILAVGARHSCAVTGDRDVSCWGWNSLGQLGNGGGADSFAPVVVSGVELQGRIRDLFAGGTHSCTILEPNTLVCWGGNDYGQLGLGDRMARSTPTRVSGISARAVQGAAGDYHTCVHLDTDDVACWGYGFYGALGTGRTDDELTPRVVVVPND